MKTWLIYTKSSVYLTVVLHKKQLILKYNSLLYYTYLTFCVRKLYKFCKSYSEFLIVSYTSSNCFIDKLWIMLRQKFNKIQCLIKVSVHMRKPYFSWWVTLYYLCTYVVIRNYVLIHTFLQSTVIVPQLFLHTSFCSIWMWEKQTTSMHVHNCI